MAKDITEKKEKKERKEKKEKKEKRSEVDGVKKSKKEKKEKKDKAEANSEVTEALEVALIKPSKQAVDEDGDVDMDAKASDVPLGALVPFAFPLAEDGKEMKKILRTIKKSAKNKTLKRGVKEVVKALRKSDNSKPSSSGISNPPSIVVIAADISPMDVISHLPVLCEEHNIPYIYVKSRAELGEASSTKRPTSVVMIGKERASKKGADVKEDDKKDFEEAYAGLISVVGKASQSVRK